MVKIMQFFGLQNKAQLGWAMYDWANSAMVTVIITAVFPVFFVTYAASGMDKGQATLRYSTITTIALIVVALMAPILGTVSDRRGGRKKFLAVFLFVGVTAVGLMATIQQGGWLYAGILFALANIGLFGSFVFYDALLPHNATADQIDRVSTGGYALGYLGGGLCLALCLAILLRPSVFGLPTTPVSSIPVKIGFGIVALWWAGFSTPLLRWTFDPLPSKPTAVETSDRTFWLELKASLKHLAHLGQELRQYKQATLFLVAFLLYNDGIGTIIRMAAVFGTEIGVPRTTLIATILVIQFVGIPFALIFGKLAKPVGIKPMLLLGLFVYSGLAIFAYFIQTPTQFIAMGMILATVQGGTQALSRSLFASLIPKSRSGEFFGLFAIFEKAAGILGPAFFSLAMLVGGTSRNAILSIILFFIAGGYLLLKVDVQQGQRQANPLF